MRILGIQIGRTPKFTAALAKEESWKTRQAERLKSSAASNPFLGRIIPPVPFKDRNDYYVTIGRLQNAVDTLVLNVLLREWHFDDDKHHPEAIKQMEQWQKDIKFGRWMGNIIRNWCLHGLNIISPEDWIPVQMESIEGLTRDSGGDPQIIWQNVKGNLEKLDANDFLWAPYITLDRLPFPVAMFESLMREFEDIDGKIAKPVAQLYRQSIQDIMKIHHKYASPRVIYVFPGVDKTTIDDDIAPLIEAMGPGDRLALNVAPEGEVQLVQETVDGKARFSESLDKLVDEMDTGLQTTANRVIAEPSAMADAREGGQQDDDRVMGIMELLTEFIDVEVIPRITGLEIGTVNFKWGTKDSFSLVYPQELRDALADRIIDEQQVRFILEKHFNWEIPEVTEMGNMSTDQDTSPGRIFFQFFCQVVVCQIQFSQL